MMQKELIQVKDLSPMKMPSLKPELKYIKRTQQQPSSLQQTTRTLGAAGSIAEMAAKVASRPVNLPGPRSSSIQHYKNLLAPPRLGKLMNRFQYDQKTSPTEFIPKHLPENPFSRSYETPYEFLDQSSSQHQNGGELIKEEDQNDRSLTNLAIVRMSVPDINEYEEQFPPA